MAVAVMAVSVSCTDKGEQPPLPEITVDQSQLAFDYDVGQKEIVVTTNREWSVESSADWLAFDPSEGGSVGDMQSYTVTVTALRNNVGNSRQANPEDIYSSSFGIKLDGDNPALGSSSCWYGSDYEFGYALDTRQFYASSTRVTVRNSSSTNSEGYPGATGGNHIHFGSDMPSFTIGNLKMHPNIRTVEVSFGLLRNQYDETGTIDNSVNPDEFPVYVSCDGQVWLPLEYIAAPTGDDVWSYCSGSVTFADAIDTFYVRFTTTVASTYRLDDVSVTASDQVGENPVDWSAGTEYELGEPVTLQ